MTLRNIAMHGALMAAFAAAFTAALTGQAMTQITGTVLDEAGKPIQNAEVKITRTDIKANYSVKTNKQGKYTYATLPLGTYDIVVNVGGKPVFETKGVRTNYAEPVTINVDLSKPPVQAAAGAPPVPAGPAEPTEAEKKAIEEAKAKFEKEMKEYQEAQSKNEALQKAYNAGMEAAKARDWATAIENFNRAGEIDPSQHVVFAQLADVYQKRAEASRGADRLNDYKASAAAYLKAIAIKPDDPVYRYNASVVLARSNDMDAAQAQLNEAIRLDPSGAGRGWRNLGAVYFDTNRGEAAEAAYRKAIEVDPKHPDAYFQLGVTLMQRAEEKDGKLVAPDGTAEAFQKYLELAPNGPAADSAKDMLAVLGAPITNSISRAPAPAPAKQTKGKGK
jgi:tetratricopeptide (TPR) repeat protein